MIEDHEQRLQHLADLVGGDFRDVQGAGAAGGLGFGCLAFCGARLEPGFDLVADLLDLEQAISQADAVIPGKVVWMPRPFRGKVRMGSRFWRVSSESRFWHSPDERTAPRSWMWNSTGSR